MMGKGLLDFHGTCKMLFAIHLKHSSFWPSADFKLMPNDLAGNTEQVTH
jgi:hypothetical protein